MARSWLRYTWMQEPYPLSAKRRARNGRDAMNNAEADWIGRCLTAFATSR
jgi:hypothetical protein